MTGKKQIDLDALRFGESEFDRVMRKALQVAPPDDKKGKKPGNAKPRKAAKAKARG